MKTNSTDATTFVLRRCIQLKRSKGVSEISRLMLMLCVVLIKSSAKRK